MGSAIGNIAGGLLGGGAAGGGGGGGLLSTIGTIAGGFFGGPIGAALGGAVGGLIDGQMNPEQASAANLVQQATGNGVNGAAQQLAQAHGMPKFLVDEIKHIVAEALGDIEHPNASPQATQEMQDAQGGDLDNFTQDLIQMIVDQVRKEMKGEGKEGGAEGAGKSGKSSAGSWMLAIAKAMGDVMGKKASKLVELSEQITQQTNAADGGKNKDAASRAQQSNAEFQATSQEFNLLQTTFSTAIKAIGEGMSSVARKQ